MNFGESLKKFNNMHYELEAVYHDISVKFGISDSAMVILYELCSNGGKCSFGSILENSGLTKQTVSSSLKKLEVNKIISFLPGDGRRKNIQLTEYGRQYASNTVSKMIDAENQALGKWTDEEFDMFCELYKRYAECMKAFSDSIERYEHI